MKIENMKLRLDLKSQFIYLPKQIVNEIENFEKKEAILNLSDGKVTIEIGGHDE